MEDTKCFARCEISGLHFPQKKKTQKQKTKEKIRLRGFFLLLEWTFISLYHSQQLFILSSIGSGSLRSNKVTSMEMFVVS